jgi:hypothetical protein
MLDGTEDKQKNEMNGLNRRFAVAPMMDSRTRSGKYLDCQWLKPHAIGACCTACGTVTTTSDGQIAARAKRPWRVGV